MPVPDQYDYIQKRERHVSRPLCHRDVESSESWDWYLGFTQLWGHLWHRSNTKTPFRLPRVDQSYPSMFSRRSPLPTRPGRVPFIFVRSQGESSRREGDPPKCVQSRDGNRRWKIRPSFGFFVSRVQTRPKCSVVDLRGLCRVRPLIQEPRFWDLV